MAALPRRPLPLLLALGATVLVGTGTTLASRRAPQATSPQAAAPRQAAPQEAAQPPRVPEGPAAVASTSPLVLPSRPDLPTTADGRHYPLVPADAATTAALLAQVEAAVRAPDTRAADLPALGHQQQVIYRVLAHRPGQAEQVRAALPERWRGVFDRHIRARREFIAMHPPSRRPTRLPAWRIQAPEPAERLLGYYREAAAATGIPWQVLAAVNLVESGMGRIDGVSVADARGPMQFLPSTWAEPGIGRGGDIRDARTAIHAAARYLVRRGGLQDIRRGLWGYNNSDNYGRAVLEYAALLREDPRVYTGLYHWEIHYASAAGDIWLPVGYQESRPVAVLSWLKSNPVGTPPPGSSGY
jgi:membrane-bound lytic murein transglycosylase B